MKKITSTTSPLEYEGTPVSSIMNSDVPTCTQDATIAEAVSLFVKFDISGLPIIDSAHRVVGFLSDGDIMTAIAQHRAHSIFTGSDASMLYFDDEQLDIKIDNLKTRRVEEFMTRKVVCAHPKQSIARVAALLSHRKLKMIPVVNEEGVLQGTVQRSMVTRYIFKAMFSSTETNN